MFWLGLRFLWKVYQRGGASDLSEAARSLLLARGIQPSDQTSSHDDPSSAGSGNVPGLAGPLSFRHVGCDCEPAGRPRGRSSCHRRSLASARSTAKLQREEPARQEQQRQEERTALLHDRRRVLARRYLFQLGDAVDSLQHRVDNWAHRGGLEFSEGRFPGYWEVTSLYAVARALGAEHILDLEGVYVELRAISPDEAAKLPQHAVEQAVTEAFGFFRYHRMALAESVLDRAGDEFRLLIYSEFLRRYEDPEWNLKSLLEPVREALSSVQKERFEILEQSLADLSTSISG